MLKIDECSYDKQRDKNPVRDRDLPWEPLPDRQEKERGNKFDAEIAKRNSGAAICAATAKDHPTDQRQILVPRNRLLTVRAKRATRLINRKINRPAINAYVQERTDRRAEHERKRAKEEIVSRMLHAINYRAVSGRDVPSAMQSRCSFRRAGTSATPVRPKSEYLVWV